MSMSTFQQLLDWLNAPQHGRLLRLSYPNEDAPSVRLVANRIKGKEHLSRGFQYTVELLSDDANITLEDVHGKLMCLSIVQANGSLRPYTGYVTEFRLVKTDGGWCHYEAILVPWFEFLRLRQNNRLFTEQTLSQQAQAIFEAYGALPVWEWKVEGEESPFTMAVQFGETDHNYLSRRLEHAGHTYLYEHTDKGHTWKVINDTRNTDPISGLSPSVRYHNHGGSENEDAIAQWSPLRRSASAQLALSGFDFKNPTAVHAAVPTVNQQGNIPALEVHRYEGHYGFKHASGADALAQLRMEEIEASGKQYVAEGNCDRIEAGRWFRITDHFAHSGDDAEFLVIAVEFEATNNYLQHADEVAEYKNRFICQSKAIPWHPGQNFNSTDTKILAPQTATVVGPDSDGSLHVDPYGRVRVQFHWDRDQTHSCWIRVASNWAGGENGFICLPRVGSEVVVQWLDGNPDHPLITSGVHNQFYMPPWQLPEQKALMGLRSRSLDGSNGNLAGGQSNHIVLDDTPTKLQVQVKSDHLSSQLSVGNIHRIEDNAGRKDARGQGFELCTGGHGAVRAGNGLLLTTEARPNAQAHITDMAETVERLAQGQELHEYLSKAAHEAKAQQTGDQDEVVKELKAQADQIKGSGGNPEQGKFPEFQAPHLTLASPAGIQSTTQGSTHVASIEHNALTSGGHTSVSSGKSFLASAKDAVRMFAYRTGMKLIAAAGDIDITTLKDSINLLAKLNITHTADKITIKALTEVEIVGGTSFSKWNASGIEHGTNGPWRQQAANHSLSGPANAPGPTLPAPISFTDLVQKQSLVFNLRSHAAGNRSVANEPYEVYKGGALVEKGVTDEIGQLVVKDHEPGTPAYVVQLTNGARFDLAVHEELDPGDPGQRLANQGFRGPKGAQGRVEDYAGDDGALA
jgi:type VI secretion system secreted protein VgrG